MTIRTKTIEYAFPLSTTSLASAAARAFTQIAALAIPETTSRTFRSVIVEVSLVDNGTTAVSLTAMRIQIALGGGALDTTGPGAVLDEVVDGVVTLRESIRLQNSASGGKASGLDLNAPVFRNLADTKDRITAVTDADGNRSSVTLDLT